jgi:hypothetical protein
MRDGTGADSLNPWGVAMFRTLKTVQPQSDTEQSAYDHWVDQTTDREQARQDRVHSASGVIPPPLWIVLIFISAIVFAYMLFFADPGEGAVSQAMLMGAVISVISVLLLLLVTLNKPYQSGVGGLKPDAMERTLGLVSKALTAIDAQAVIPCDANGVKTAA